MYWVAEGKETGVSFINEQYTMKHYQKDVIYRTCRWKGKFILIYLFVIYKPDLDQCM
jgi:hypothetical protein